MPIQSSLANAALSLVAYVNPKNLTLGKLGKLLAVLAVLANLKVVPFFWHSRFWYSLYIHLLSRRRVLPNPTQLFVPIKIESRSPLYECDFNYHKSNSTYFSDLDIARTHLVAHLIKKSLRLRRQRGDKPLYVALGGVVSLFRREIKPYEKYEIWSRVLSWDDKWFWVVSHFVSAKGDPKHDGKRKIYASSLSKYVFKVERKTIPPIEVLEESGLLPKRPVGNDISASTVDVSTSAVDISKPAGIMESADIIVKTEILKPHLQHLDTDSNAGSDVGSGAKNGDVAVSSGPGSADGLDAEEDELEMIEKITKWDWETVEKLRRQGMKTAHHMLGLDALEGEFEKGNSRVGNRSAGYPNSVLGLSWA
ncbi:hypothetical protein ABW19_dt0205523 [Dactylella cylindrospora]|nr:hypothetical protein ABW19_dt0205523 [Dactylella cylindrospora]